MQVNNKESTVQQPQRTQKSELQGSSEEFLQMFIAQLKNQDPTDPMESTDMVKNIAQLNQISYLEDMKNSLDKLADGEDELSLGDIGSLIDKKITYNGVQVPEGEVSGRVPGFSEGMTLELVNEQGGKIKDVELSDSGEFSFSMGGDQPQGYFQVRKGDEILGNVVNLDGQVKGVDLLSGEVVLDNNHTILYDNIKKIISGSYE